MSVDILSDEPQGVVTHVQRQANGQTVCVSPVNLMGDAKIRVENVGLPVTHESTHRMAAFVIRDRRVHGIDERSNVYKPCRGWV